MSGLTVAHVQPVPQLLRIEDLRPGHLYTHNDTVYLALYASSNCSGITVVAIDPASSWTPCKDFTREDKFVHIGTLELV